MDVRGRPCWDASRMGRWLCRSPSWPVLCGLVGPGTTRRLRARRDRQPLTCIGSSTSAVSPGAELMRVRQRLADDVAQAGPAAALHAELVAMRGARVSQAGHVVGSGGVDRPGVGPCGGRGSGDEIGGRGRRRLDGASGGDLSGEGRLVAFLAAGFDGPCRGAGHRSRNGADGSARPQLRRGSRTTDTRWSSFRSPTTSTLDFVRLPLAVR